ncbi:SRPBCC family protein [Arthrobacter sp. Marseille-P9274]|uniref:SRPBCC family protein n=1 Tax=Arthrobacter sp. Marseille-P9274 TaxID=2866572 RepID=UPI0021C56EC2|nr:SRPBCC family protein [Arthrobacter sp. Marseille-P9274]
MDLQRTFTVNAPIGTVWDALMDIERVAGCVPGAQVLQKLSEDTYQVGMKVKLGPVSMQYKGTLNVVERDEAARRAVMEGQAQETHGQGTAKARVDLQLAEEGSTTTGTASAAITLSGKAAVMGRSVIGSVADQMLGAFTGNLQSMLNSSSNPAPAGGSPQQPAAEPPVGTTAGAAPGETTAPPPPAAAAAAAPTETTGPTGTSHGTSAPPSSADSGLDALAVARGMLADQLASPGKVLALLAAAAVLGYLAGRCSPGRSWSRHA